MNGELTFNLIMWENNGILIVAFYVLYISHWVFITLSIELNIRSLHSKGIGYMIYIVQK
jgi:hypothetical protein